MIRVSYEDILKRIEEKTGLPRTEIEQKINAKLKQLSGLISKEGAGHIVANELGIRLIEQISGRLQIKNILGGMRDVETVGRVVDVFEAKPFKSERSEGTVGSFILGDETGTIRVVLWNTQAEKVSQLEPGMVVKIVGGYVRTRNERPELHLNDRSKLIIQPSDETVGEVKPRYARKRINDVQPDEMVEILGTIYRVSDMRFFEVCPVCRKRTRLHNEQNVCEQHGEVDPKHSYVFNVFLDDGTGTIRLVCFREHALKLMGKQESEVMVYREQPELFEDVKTELLGNIIKVAGRVVKNELFERLELIARKVDTSPDPEKELALMQAEAAKRESEGVKKTGTDEPETTKTEKVETGEAEKAEPSGTEKPKSEESEKTGITEAEKTEDSELSISYEKVEKEQS